jgi:hypothetical protein
MKIKDYNPKTRTEALGWLQEEAIEVAISIARCYRFGADNIYEGRTNIQIVKEELEDLKKSIEAAERLI